MGSGVERVVWEQMGLSARTGHLVYISESLLLQHICPGQASVLSARGMGVRSEMKCD